MSRRSDLTHLINDIMKNQKTITKEINKVTKEIKEIQGDIDIFENSLHELDKRIEENNLPDYMLKIHAKVKNSTTATLRQYKEHQSNLKSALTRYNEEIIRLDNQLTSTTVLFAQKSLSMKNGSWKYKSNSRGGRKRNTRKNKNK
jgi:peptidoglycan hydrolase CwlO-like protein